MEHVGIVPDPSTSEQGLWTAVIATIGGTLGAIVKLFKNGRDIAHVREENRFAREHTKQIADVAQANVLRIAVLEVLIVEIQRRLSSIDEVQVRVDAKLDRILDRLRGHIP